MKKCNNCGKQVKDEDNFCRYCGSPDLSPDSQPDYSFYTQPENPAPQPYSNGYPPYGQEPQMPPVQPKKSKKGIIIAIAAIVAFLVLFLIGFMLGKGSTDINSITDDSDTAAETPTIEYTKGTFDGTVYVNEWADIKFELPEGFTNADSEYYTENESETTDCGLFIISENSYGSLIIGFERLPAFPSIDEEEYLDIVTEQLVASTDVLYEIASPVTVKNIAGQDYYTQDCAVQNGDINLTQTYYMRKIGNTMMFIIATDFYGEQNDQLVETIETYK